MQNPSPFLTVALAAARAAEDVILKYYAGDVATTLKEDQSPVTIADKEAEQVIKDMIHEAFPEHGFLAEESGTTESTSEYMWIIDPIDGTRNFIRHVPLFGTLIALKKGDEIILGVSNVPIFKELIYAEKGKGAYKDGVRLSVSKKATLKEAYLSYGGIKQSKQQNVFPQLMTLVDAVGRERGLGDSWPYHLLAEGKIDIVVDPKVHMWDVAPAKIIIEEAGGKLTDKEGHGMGTGTFVAVATNGLLHDAVLQHFVAK